MRELKFRAWCINSNCWFKDGFSISQDGLFLYDDNLQEWEIQANFIIEQFTGLHHKNGKEIYEGDILKEGIRHGTDTGLIYKVVWFQDDTHNGWNIAKKGIRGDEIIGNIYENPDLAGVAV